MSALLEIRGLKTSFSTDAGAFNAVDGVSLTLEPGRTLGLVGESGCGKSVTALSILGLISKPGRITAGEILFEGEDLLKLPPARLRAVRGDRISMIFQEPMTSLNPAFTIGDQIVEGILKHRAIGRDAARRQAIEMLERVRMPSPAQRFDEHPHRLSGGMRQRAMIAMALALKPKLLIADEPTTALDVTIQAQILELMRMLRDETGTAIILITHDLGVVAQVADRIAVMYAGRIIEQADVYALYQRPAHPYTRALLESIPGRHRHGEPLTTIRGLPPNLLRIPPGCPFHPRCPIAVDLCKEVVPGMAEPATGRLAACHRTQEVLDGRA